MGARRPCGCPPSWPHRPWLWRGAGGTKGSAAEPRGPPVPQPPLGWYRANCKLQGRLPRAVERAAPATKPERRPSCALRASKARCTAASSRCSKGWCQRHLVDAEPLPVTRAAFRWAGSHAACPAAVCSVAMQVRHAGYLEGRTTRPSKWSCSSNPRKRLQRWAVTRRHARNATACRPANSLGPLQTSRCSTVHSIGTPHSLRLQPLPLLPASSSRARRGGCSGAQPRTAAQALHNADPLS